MTDVPEQSSDADRPDAPIDQPAAQTDPPDDIPEVEDSNAPDTDEASVEEAIAEDDPELLDGAARSLDLASDDGASSEEPAESTQAESDESSDTDSIQDEVKTDAEERAPDWSNERSAHRVAVELKHVEAEVRRLLENNDTRRKRRLAGTRRWLELEEDIIAWRHTGRPDEETLAELSALVAKRHQLFKQLEFLTSIRPGWRSQAS